MIIDLRLPLGMLFVALGAIMVAYGLASDPAIYGPSFGINVNLWWGFAQIAFGFVTGIFGYRATIRSKDKQV